MKPARGTRALALAAVRRPLGPPPISRLAAARGAPSWTAQRLLTTSRLRSRVAASALAPATRQYASAAAAAAAPPIPATSGPLPAAPTPVIGAYNVRSTLLGVAEILRDEIGGSTEWLDRVEKAVADLDATRRGQMVVVGEPVAAPHDVVTAVLEDPLTDSNAAREALLKRYFGTSTEYLRITYAPKNRREEGRMACPASFLSEAKTDILEVDPKVRGVLSTVIAADTVVVVIDPIRLAAAPMLQELLPVALSKGHVHFVVNGTLPPHATEAGLREMLAAQISHLVVPCVKGEPKYDVSFVQADKALHACRAVVTALAPGSQANKGDAFNTFQTWFNASNIGPLRGKLMTDLPESYQLATAAHTSELALAYLESVLASDRDVLRSAMDVVADLRREAMQSSSKARRLSIVARGSEAGEVQGSVKQSVDKSKRDLQLMFDGRLSWLGLVARLRVDDVGADVGAYIQRTFAKDIEKQLVFEAGQLSQLQATLAATSDKTARRLSNRQGEAAGHPFSSPLLLNHLSSLALSIPPVGPASLLPPVTSRRQQLVTVAVPRLQVTAQRSLLSAYTMAFVGCSLSWCAYVPPLAALSAGTAVGLGALSIVGSLALGQAFWARAQKRFWRDWKQVTDMLKEDLAANYDKTVNTLVVAKPHIAAEGLQELVRKRQTRLADLETRIASLRSRAHGQVEANDQSDR